MSQSVNQFAGTLHKFVNDLHRYTPSEGSKKFIEVFNDLDMDKVILRYYNILNEHSGKIKNRDETLFSNNLNVFPGIELSECWKKLSSGQKRKIWIYLEMLFVLSELIIQDNSEKEAKEKSNDLSNMAHTIVKNEEGTVDNADQNFNPYVGVGSSNGEYSIEEMFSGPQTLPGEENNDSALPGMANFGLNSMFNIGELKDQLKNMKKEDIEEATNNIKKMLGNNDDDNTSTLISDMLNNITEELKNDEMNEGDPFKNIVKIAESVADKMKPQMESSNIDMSQLLNSTQSLASQCEDENGNNLFAGGVNPFNLVNQMMNMNQGTNNNNNNASSSNVNNNNASRSLNGNSGQGFDQQEFMNEYNNVLRNMGLGNPNGNSNGNSNGTGNPNSPGNIDLSNLDIGALQQQMMNMNPNLAGQNLDRRNIRNAGNSNRNIPRNRRNNPNRK